MSAPTPLLDAQIRPPVYTVTLRALQTLAPYQILPWFQSLGWTRDLYGAGSFALQVHVDDIERDAVLHPVRGEVQETVFPGVAGDRASGRQRVRHPGQRAGRDGDHPLHHQAPGGA